MDFNIGSVVVSVKENVMEFTFHNKVETISLDQISSVELTKMNYNLLHISVVLAAISFAALIFVNEILSIIILFPALLCFIGGFFVCETLTFHVNGRGKFPLMVQKRKANKLYSYVSELLNTRK